MRSSLAFTIFFVTMLLPIRCLAEDSSLRVLEDEISGFTIDSTITRLGHEFSRYLSEYRNREENSGDYNLTVYERPSARWGNLIWVTHNHRTVYRNFIQPSGNNIDQLAEVAAQQIHDTIKQLKLQALFSDNFDLDKDEL